MAGEYVELRLTRTPLGGSADTPIVEEFGGAHGRILRAEYNATQSIGNESGSITLRNHGDVFSDYATGDGLKLEARASTGTWTTLIDGYIGRPMYRPGLLAPVVEFTIRGWTSLLDLAHVPSEQEFFDTDYVDIADSLIDTVFGAGFSRSIDADTTNASHVVIPEGVTLRQALDIVRSGLNGASDKWEQRITVVSGSKQYQLFKRGTSLQATYGVSDLYPESTRDAGDVSEIVNDVDVFGATRPEDVIDFTGESKTATVRIDSTAEIVAQSFTPSVEPLFAVTTQADRSVAEAPPTLSGYVARNSDNIDVVKQGVISRYQGSVLRDNSTAGDPADLDDGDDTTTTDFTINAADSNVEQVAWDLGSGNGQSVHGVRVDTDTATGVNPPDFDIQYSDNDSSWTTAASWTHAGGRQVVTVTSPPEGPHRYWRLIGTGNGSNRVIVFNELNLLEYGNEATDPSNPDNLHFDDGATTDVTTTGDSEQELFFTDYQSNIKPAKVVFEHNESGASASVVLRVQKSTDAVSWTDIAVLATSTSTVTDTITVEPDSFRYLRILHDDDRAPASGNFTTSVDHVETYLHRQTVVDGFTEPLTGDTLLGSSVSWTRSNLVEHPGLLDEQTYASPNVMLDVNWGYWFVFDANDAATSSSWWELDYATVTGEVDALRSTDNGSTWASIATDAVLMHRFKFNNRQLSGSASDSASQTTYSSFIPNGVLTAAFVDDALTTQTMVDAEATAIVNRRASTIDRFNLVVPFDPGLDVGNCVRLTAEAADRFGLGHVQTDIDVVEVRHMLSNDSERGAVTRIVGNEHFTGQDDAFISVAGLANVRRVSN